MSNVTDTSRQSETETVEAAPAAAQEVVVLAATVEEAVITAVDPNGPPDDEVVAATLRTLEEANSTVEDLVAAGVPREKITILSSRENKRNFMKRYVHRDGDRHTHAGVASVYFALGGACVFGIFGVLIAQYFALGTILWILLTLAGGLVGATLGAILGGLAMRTADDSSIEIVESVAAEGTLVAVSRPLGQNDFPLDEAARVIARHNGRVMRLRHQTTQADLHPGDMRPSYLWTPANVERPVPKAK